jgi:hypothetical protein
VLYDYLQRTQRLLADETQAIYSLDDLTQYVNQARQEVAAQGQCIRRSTPVNGSIMELQVVEPGSGYTAPTLSISPPDAPNGNLPYPLGAQATGTAQQIGGKLSNCSVSFGGGGYFQPVVTVNDPHGVGAVVKAVLSPFNQTTFGLEEYKFSDIDLTPFPGVQSILSVRSVSIIWAQWQYSLSWVSFSKYQALIRQYVATFYAPPVWACQFGQGVDGSIHMFPLADQPYQMCWDILCLPNDLEDDESPEAIPAPWTTAVPFYAAHLALLGRSAETPQMAALAFKMFNERDGGLFGMYMRRARAFSQPGRVSSFYGRV